MEATLCRGGTFGTTGTGSSATACRSRKVSPVSYPTVSFDALRLSGAFQDEANVAILVTMVTAGYCI